jgi:YD repeat-containing protein
MLTAQRGSWPVTFVYDGANRVTQTVQNGRTVRYVYDIPGHTRQVTYPGGRVITEHTDFRSRLDRIDDGGIPPIVQYTYGLANEVGSRTSRNGVIMTPTYNANYWTLSLEHTKNGSRIAGFGYSQRFGEPVPGTFGTGTTRAVSFSVPGATVGYAPVQATVGELVTGSFILAIAGSAYAIYHAIRVLWPWLKHIELPGPHEECPAPGFLKSFDRPVS